MPVALGPVGATGCTPAAAKFRRPAPPPRAGIPYTLSTVSVCSIEEVASQASGALWSQLYVLKDRGYMRNALERVGRRHENPGIHRRYADPRLAVVGIIAQACPGRTPPCDSISRPVLIHAGQ